MKDSLFDLTGKTAVITGGARWLGLDVAETLAGHGANIIITSRALERAQNAAMRISEQYGVDALGLELDVCDFQSVKRMADSASAWKERIDILVNNAGGGSGASEGDLFARSPEDIRRMIDVNLTGLIWCCREVGKHMFARQSGKVINIASVAGLVGRDRAMYRSTGKMEQPVDYAAAKAGVIGFTRDLAALLSPHGIYVNSISPGGFDKGDLPESFVSLYNSETMLGRMGAVGRDIKGAALFLASPASDYITGHNLVVDGGFSVWK